MSRRRSGCSFVMQALEARVLLSAVPIAHATDEPAMLSAVVASATIEPADLLSKAVRQQVLDKWNGPNKDYLQSRLDLNRLGAFDETLLSTMQQRGGQTFYWNVSEIDENVAFIQANMNTAGIVANADAILAHKFPEQGNSSSYDVQLPPGDIDWLTQPGTTSNPEFIHSLNRQSFWLDLAQAHLFTGSSAYIVELAHQLASWSNQHPALSNPNAWSSVHPRWNLLDTALRADIWCWTYQMVVNSDAWTPAANTLFLWKLWQHGDFLRRVTPYDTASNRTIFHARGLLEIGHLVPEFVGAENWRNYSRSLLFAAMDAQFYDDGGHVEQSPGYTANVLNDLLEVYWLERTMGSAGAWPADRVSRLSNAMRSYFQILSPDGTQPALSDTYRSTALHMLTKARIALDSTEWPANKPRIRDVWLFGATTANDYIAAPVHPALGDRGLTHAMTDAGYYVMRSGSDADARQIIFDAGPTGGIHGHFDLLNFELFGDGRPLISDPGLFQYDDSADRNYVISTRAHNTISVDGENHAALEGKDNPSFGVSQWTVTQSHAQITAYHFGYAHLLGRPVLARSMWYDLNGTILIVDWAEATRSHNYTVSFNLPTLGDEFNVTGVHDVERSFRTRYPTGGNVKVWPLLRSGQDVTKNPRTFVSNEPPPNHKSDAYRFTMTGSGEFQIFATLITTYSGTTAPNVTAEWVTSNPQPGAPVVLRLNRDGSSEDITFTPPAFVRPELNLVAPNGSSNGIAWDSHGRIHLAFYDRTDQNLKYTVRDINGTWSIVQTVDPDLHTGVYLSMKLDSKGIPGIAYFDGHHGDLKYARMFNGAWHTETVDWRQSVGLYPSLVFSRKDGPMISYYHRSRGELRLATSITEGWQIRIVDSAGDVGRSGSMTLDPNRPDASKVAIGYEDTTRGWYKYAIEFRDGWKIQTIDSTTTIGGGYMSLAFQPFTAADGTYYPSVSYYDAGRSALKFAVGDGTNWYTQTIASAGRQGLYTALLYDDHNQANIFYFDRLNNLARRARGKFGSWTITVLGSGGREISAARYTTGQIVYTSLDESVPGLFVHYLRS